MNRPVAAVVTLSAAVVAIGWSAGAVAGTLAAAHAAVLSAIAWRVAGGPRRRLDRLFWAVTLRPLAALPPAERERRLEALAARPIHHPITGPRRFAAAELKRKLARVGAIPLAELVGPDLLEGRALAERRLAGPRVD